MDCKLNSPEKLALWISLAALAIAPLAAHAETGGSDPSITWPGKLREDMVRLSQVEWRLRYAAGELCSGASSATGILIDHVGAYRKSDRSLVQAALGLSNQPQVAGVVPESPADQSGIEAGDEILSIDGVAAIELGDSGNFKLLADDLMDRLAESPADEPVSFEIRRDGRTMVKSVVPQKLCATRFILKTRKGINAFTDGLNVGVTVGLMRFTANDDELALIAGHELAHVIVGSHPESEKLSRKQKEDRADALGAALAHCAGYDVPLSLDFWTRFGKHDWLGFLRDPTHRSPKRRRARLEELSSNLACPVKDWNPDIEHQS